MNGTILLVEDNEDDVLFLRRALKLAGILNPLQVVRDGRQAIDYLEGSGAYMNRAEFPLPCLVLLDLKLPRVMGLDVLRWIDRRLCHAARPRADTSSAANNCGAPRPQKVAPCRPATTHSSR